MFERSGLDAGMPPHRALLDLGFSNRGTRAAERVSVNVLVPRGFGITPCEQNGWPIDMGRVETSSERLDGEIGVVFWADTIGPIDVGVFKPVHLLIEGVWPGTSFPVLLKMTHEDSAHEIHVRRILHIPASGTDIVVSESS